MTLSINVSFLWLQRFKQFVNSVNLGIRLFSNMFDLSLEKTIPGVFADSEDHMNFSCLKYLILLLLKDPIRNIIVLLIFSFKPEICLNSSRICISFRNVFNDPSIANVASSANIVLLNSLFFFILVPLISYSFNTVAVNIPIHKIKRYGDSGQP